MGTIYNCDSAELIQKASEEMKKLDSFKAPEWASFAKTGMHKERPPFFEEWWQIRAASVLRQIYKKGPVGVQKLRNKYGGKKNRGVKKGHFFKGSGSIARKVLQQLEAAGFVKQEKDNVHKGRVITAKGKNFLDTIAASISKVPQQTKKTEKAAKKEKKEAKETEKNKVEAAKEKPSEIVNQDKKEAKQEVVKETKEESATIEKKEDTKKEKTE